MAKPPENPGLNPIEDLWQELKYFLHSKVKQQSKQELVEEIKKYWGASASVMFRDFMRAFNAATLFYSLEEFQARMLHVVR